MRTYTCRVCGFCFVCVLASSSRLKAVLLQQDEKWRVRVFERTAEREGGRERARRGERQRAVKRKAEREILD